MGGYWMEIIPPKQQNKKHLHNWIVNVLQPHAIRYDWGVWDQVNGWRIKNMKSVDIDYWQVIPKHSYMQERETLRRLMEGYMYGLSEQRMLENRYTAGIGIVNQISGGFGGLPTFINPSIGAREAVVMDLGKPTARHMWGRAGDAL